MFVKTLYYSNIITVDASVTQLLFITFLDLLNAPVKRLTGLTTGIVDYFIIDTDH